MKPEPNQKTTIANTINSVISDTYGEMPHHLFRPVSGFEHRYNIQGKNVDFNTLKQKISEKLGVGVKSHKSVMYIPTESGHVYVHHAKGTVKDGFLSVQTFKPAGYENELPPFRNSKRDSIVEAYLNQTKESLFSSGRSPEQENRDNDLASLWHKTATQPWHEYMKTVQNTGKWGDMQSQETEENQASRQRVQEYLTKYKHLF